MPVRANLTEVGIERAANEWRPSFVLFNEVGYVDEPTSPIPSRTRAGSSFRDARPAVNAERLSKCQPRTLLISARSFGRVLFRLAINADRVVLHARCPLLIQRTTQSAGAPAHPNARSTGNLFGS